jgi:hypothetical protein
MINPTSVLSQIERWSKFIEPTYTLLRSNTNSHASSEQQRSPHDELST